MKHYAFLSQELWPSRNLKSCGPGQRFGEFLPAKSRPAHTTSGVAYFVIQGRLSASHQPWGPRHGYIRSSSAKVTQDSRSLGQITTSFSGEMIEPSKLTW